jgi:hypothetical protein
VVQIYVSQERTDRLSLAVPVLLKRSLPSSMTPTCIHFRIKQSTLPSRTRFSRGRKTALPSVLGSLRFPLAIVLPLLRAEMESSPGFMGNPFGNMP